MMVQCRRTYPTSQDLEVLGPSFYHAQDFHLVPNEEYLVVALGFGVNRPVLGTGVTVMVEDRYGGLAEVPLCLFDIVDNTPSKHWEVRVSGEGHTTLWPPLFYLDHFFEDQSDGEPWAERGLAELMALLKAEAGIRLGNG